MIGEGSEVYLKRYPGSNLLHWDYGTVQKVSVCEDSGNPIALIQTIVDGIKRTFWEFLDNIET